MKKFFLFFLFFLIIFGHSFCFGQPNSLWDKRGVLINDTPGNTIQQRPKAISDGKGGFIVVFEDYRKGDVNLYVQKVDAESNLLWGKDGIPLCEAEGDQIFPEITSDGKGGAFIVWQDNREKDFNIYCQRIDENGYSLWTKDGISICNEKEAQVFPQIVQDDEGGAIIVWHDYRNGDEDIFAQRISESGNLLWDLNSEPIIVNSGTQWFPKIVKDNEGGAYIVWEDRRSGDFDIYAQKINKLGKCLWNRTGVDVIKTSGNQQKAAVELDKDGCIYVAWKDMRFDNLGIYCQYLDKGGTRKFPLNGINLAKSSVTPSPPKITLSSDDCAVVVWSDPHAGDKDIYGQKIFKNGELKWGDDGIDLVRKAGPQTSPSVIGDVDGFYLVWIEKNDILCQRFDFNAFPRWNIIELVESSTDPQNCCMVLYKNPFPESSNKNSSNGVFVLWQDKRSGNFDILGQRLSSNGELAWDHNGSVINNSYGAVLQQNVVAVNATANNYIFAFEDYRYGIPNIYFQKVDSNGNLMWGIHGIPAAYTTFPQKNPKIISDGKGSAIVIWEDYENPSAPKIYSQKINTQGKTMWGKRGVILTPALLASKQSNAEIIPDGKGGAIVVFCDLMPRFTEQDIYGQRINNKGAILWSGEGLKISDASGFEDSPQICEQSLIVAWTDYRNSVRNSDIYAQKLNLEGNLLWDKDGVPICTAPQVQRNPKVVADNTGGAVIVWTDKGSGGYDIYAQRVDKTGSYLWLKDGLPICQEGRIQQRPVISKNLTVAWEDFRFGNWDIFAQKIDLDGNLLWQKEGVKICGVLGTQYSPQIINVNRYNVIAWEDYRTGKNYQIYMQKIDGTGQIYWDEDGVLLQEAAQGGRDPKLKNSKNSFILFWEDFRTGGKAIFAQRFSIQ